MLIILTSILVFVEFYTLLSFKLSIGLDSNSGVGVTVIRLYTGANFSVNRRRSTLVTTRLWKGNARKYNEASLSEFLWLIL